MITTIRSTLWRIRAAYWLRRLGGCRPDQAWLVAAALLASNTDGERPRIAVEVEISYWGD